jgi:UDP-N-acetylmuramoylalanine--D-glutamate ligase
MQDLANRQVLVLGCGASGLAMAQWCARAGARLTVADTREAPPQLEALRETVPAAAFVAGEFTPALAQGADIVLRSPGLAPAQVAPVVVAAREQGLPVWGELALFAQALAGLRAQQAYVPVVLAVTGTNGKTTVTALTGQLAERAGRSVAVAGNIGPSLLATLADRLDAGALPQVWVLELSSFQLEDVADFEPTAAAVLNVTQDHLDWHGSMEAYAAAKARVFGANGIMVLNREDPRVMAMLAAPVRLKGGRMSQRGHVTFGGDMPQRPGDFGIEVVNGMAWLVRAHEADETQKRRTRPSHAPKGAASGGADGSGRPGGVRDEAEDIHIQRLMPADALRIRGRHNAVNALAALALTTAVGLPLAPMLYGLREYRGEPHRVEAVGQVRDIEYFDDSKGTNVGATVAALTGLGAERKLVVILGGDGKGQDFAPLAEPVARHARAVVLIGRDAPRIREVLAATGVPLLDAPTLPEAVQVASRQAQSGDAVLMSPACASFDMFRNYEHRAEVFRGAVHAIADDAGAMIEGDTR